MPSLTLLPLLPLPLLLLVLYKIVSPNPPSPPPSPSSSLPSSSAPLPTLLLRLTTAHKRLLPVPAQHAFGYPLLYFGVDLEEMEEKRIERRAQLTLPTWLGGGGFGVKVFGYRRENELGGKVWGVTRLEEAGYLSPTRLGEGGEEGKREEIESELALAPLTQPLRLKLIHLLSTHLASSSSSAFSPSPSPSDIAARLGRVYLITMPAFLGTEGINPLSVWLCYEKDDSEGGERKLWTVVLEVHNTFGERHVYVLETGKGEEKEKLHAGYHHRWTFPRSFHVSPFNSRDGYYTLSLQAPIFPPSSSPSPTSSSSSPASTASPPTPPITLSVSLLLLTPDKTPKLFARLSSTPNSPPLPFTTRNILYQTLFVFPVALLATTPRILWNAGVLAFKKGLRVYGRPEMVGRGRRSSTKGARDDATKEDEDEGTSSASSSEDEKIVDPDANAMGEQNDWGLVQTLPSSQPGGLLYLPLSSTELNSGALVRQFLKLRLHQLSLSHPTRRVTITLTPSSPNLPIFTISSPTSPTNATTEEDERLDLLSISPVAYTLLLLSPTPQHALQTLSQPFPQTILDISIPSLFLELFSPPPPAASKPKSNATLLTHWIRTHNPLSPPGVRELAAQHPRHWIDALEGAEVEGKEGEGEGAGAGGWSLPLGLMKVVLAEWAEEAVMRGLGVGFVKGGEGWRGVWRRSGALGEAGSGSAREEESGKVEAESGKVE